MLHTHGARPHAKFCRRMSRRFRGDSKQTLRRLPIIIDIISSSVWHRRHLQSRTRLIVPQTKISRDLSHPRIK